VDSQNLEKALSLSLKQAQPVGSPDASERVDRESMQYFLHCCALMCPSLPVQAADDRIIVTPAKPQTPIVMT